MGEGAGREDSDKKTPSPFVAALPPLPIIDRYTVRSLQASSPIEPREWLRKGLSLPQPPLSCLFSRVSRASTFHDIPQMESSRRQKSAIQDSGCLWGVLQSLEGNFEGSKNVFKSLAKEARWYELSTATKVGRVC